jgi:hypothetical protein
MGFFKRYWTDNYKKSGSTDRNFFIQISNIFTVYSFTSIFFKKNLPKTALRSLDIKMIHLQDTPGGNVWLTGSPILLFTRKRRAVLTIPALCVEENTLILKTFTLRAMPKIARFIKPSQKT